MLILVINMSPPEVWGPAVWLLFHTLAEKVNENAFPFIKMQLFSQIKRICNFLPCPECSSDATKFLERINIHDIKSKNEFKNMLYLFHNWVNVKKQKPLFNHSNLEMYNNYKLIYVVNNFISKYNTKGNMRLIAESFQRNIIIRDFKTWITSSNKAFITPKIDRTIISDDIVQKEQPTTIVEEELIIQEEELTTILEEEPVIGEKITHKKSKKSKK